MSAIKISALTAAVTIDATADYLPIVQASSSTTKKINRNTLLGITGSPLGTTDTQNVTSKTLDNTNTITLKDTLFTLQDDGDATKQAKFQLSGITAGNTRTYTLPNASVTLASLTGTENLTNKTITSPTITGGSIDNSTITVDSISGHSTATIVTVGGVQLNNGTIGTSGAVTSTSILAGAVQPQALVSGTGTGWGWSTWSPTLVNISGGTQTIAKYIQIGKIVFFKFMYTLAGAGVGTNPSFTLPVAATTDYLTGPSQTIVFTASYYDAVGGTVNLMSSFLSSTTVCRLLAIKTDATYASVANVTALIPKTWATSDYLFVSGFYEVA